MDAGERGCQAPTPGLPGEERQEGHPPLSGAPLARAELAPPAQSSAFCRHLGTPNSSSCKNPANPVRWQPSPTATMLTRSRKAQQHRPPGLTDLPTEILGCLATRLKVADRQGIFPTRRRCRCAQATPTRSPSAPMCLQSAPGSHMPSAARSIHGLVPQCRLQAQHRQAPKGGASGVAGQSAGLVPTSANQQLQEGLLPPLKLLSLPLHSSTGGTDAERKCPQH